MFAWHHETSALRPVLFHLPQIFLRKIKGSVVSFFEVDDVLPFSKHMKINLGSLTHCISQPIKHRSQANCAQTNQKTATCKVQGLSANGGDKKKITRRSLNVAVSRVQVCTQTQTTIFSGFYAALSNAFIPIRRIFIKKLLLFLKNGAVQYFGLIIVQNAKSRFCLLVS